VEDIVDAIVAELELLKDATFADGGCSDILTIEAVYWGDPGIIPVNAYPCFTVQPVRDLPDIETTGYEVVNFEVLITLLIDSREFWNASVLEATGDRQMVKVMKNVRNWFRTDHNRSLRGQDGVREVKASGTDYMVQRRDSVVAKSAQVTLTVNKQREREQ
jgi:hypothetical protein